jgi:poly [ADP-ribose] polymerase
MSSQANDSLTNDGDAVKKRKRDASPAVAGTDVDTIEPELKKGRVGVGDTEGGLDPEPEELAVIGRSQVAKSRDLHIPIDEGCHIIGAKVYIDDNGVIFDALLNETRASKNANKFYRIQVSS